MGFTVHSLCAPVFLNNNISSNFTLQSVRDCLISGNFPILIHAAGGNMRWQSCYKYLILSVKPFVLEPPNNTKFKKKKIIEADLIWYINISSRPWWGFLEKRHVRDILKWIQREAKDNRNCTTYQWWNIIINIITFIESKHINCAKSNKTLKVLKMF